MKTFTFTCALILVVAACSFAMPPGSSKGAAAFEKMKSLAGKWTGKDEEGRQITIEYTVVSSGTALMESMSADSHADGMVTMYYPDRNSIMLTHYCSMGNQPRMRSKGLSDNDSRISFDYVDATNLEKPKADHMHSLVVTFKDKDHFSQDWTMMKDGKASHHGVFEFERVP